MIPTRQRALLSSPNCFLTSAVKRLQNLVWKIAKKKKKKVHHPNLCRELAPKQPYFNPFPLCFICLGKHMRAVHPPWLQSSKSQCSRCPLTARLSRRKPWAYVERCVSDQEASYTEQMGPAWDEETNLMSWLQGSTTWCKFWLCSEGRMNMSFATSVQSEGGLCKQT